MCNFKELQNLKHITYYNVSSSYYIICTAVFFFISWYVEHNITLRYVRLFRIIRE